jgi:Domain of unknown function (DUF6897)
VSGAGRCYHFEPGTGRNACPTTGVTMQKLLANMIGKKIDVYCGGSSSLRGEVIKVEEGVLHLKDSDEKTCFVSVEKIIVVWEAKDEEHRAGFVSSQLNEK